MTHPEEKLAELGLSVPEVATAGGGVRPGRCGPATTSTRPASCRCATAS